MADAVKPNGQTLEALKVKIVPIPTKFVTLYPTILLAGIISLILAMFRSEESHLFWGQFFLFFAFVNFVVGTFEFPRATVLTVILGGAAILLGLYLLNQHFGIFPWLTSFFKSLNLQASAQFYLFIFLGGIIIFFGIWIQTRFDYWELTPNELIHHHGLLGDVERFSTAAMKFNKEITDIFEYMILRSATLLITLPTQPRPIQLENVLFVGYVMKRADEILQGGHTERTLASGRRDDQGPTAAVIQSP
jgi:hypothetical protein